MQRRWWHLVIRLAAAGREFRGFWRTGEGRKRCRRRVEELVGEEAARVRKEAQGELAAQGARAAR